MGVPAALAGLLAEFVDAVGQAAAAPPAATLSYRCSTSTQTIDDAGYSGPAPDNWDIKIQVCAARSGTTVYAYTDIGWDGPARHGQLAGAGYASAAGRTSGLAARMLPAGRSNRSCGPSEKTLRSGVQQLSACVLPDFMG